MSVDCGWNENLDCNNFNCDDDANDDYHPFSHLVEIMYDLLNSFILGGK